MPEEVAAPIPQEQPPDRGWAGGRLVAWGLFCTAVWLGIVFVSTNIATEIDGEAAHSEAGLLITVIGQGVAGLIGWFAIPRLIMRRYVRLSVISWRQPTVNDVRWVVSGLVSIYAVLAVYAFSVSALGADSLLPRSTIDDDRFYQHTSVMIALGVLVIICAPIYEEAFARGFLLGGLRPYWGTIPAFVISAAVFSTLHADLGSLIPFTIAGLILGVIYVRTNSLTAASMTHFGFNVIGYSATLVEQLA